ncbi:hypothetical protein, partial [Geodermatophilus chilensis]|uniref:hypothetical protein n=1 Tax=Geodermatophilus chilensis TaxID=2035835 RepID=UPI0018E44C81
ETERQRAEQLAGEVTELEAAAAAATEELDAAVAAVDRELTRLQDAQLRVNEETAASWRAYLADLSSAGLTPPPASALRDPGSGLPERLVPVGAAAGGAQRGAAQLPR